MDTSSESESRTGHDPSDRPASGVWSGFGPIRTASPESFWPVLFAPPGRFLNGRAAGQSEKGGWAESRRRSRQRGAAIDEALGPGPGGLRFVESPGSQVCSDPGSILSRFDASSRETGTGLLKSIEFENYRGFPHYGIMKSDLSRAGIGWWGKTTAARPRCWRQSSCSHQAEIPPPFNRSHAGGRIRGSR